MTIKRKTTTKPQRKERINDLQVFGNMRVFGKVRDSKAGAFYTYWANFSKNVGDVKQPQWAQASLSVVFTEESGAPDFTENNSYVDLTDVVGNLGFGGNAEYPRLVLYITGFEYK